MHSTAQRAAQYLGEVSPSAVEIFRHGWKLAPPRDGSGQFMGMAKRGDQETRPRPRTELRLICICSGEETEEGREEGRGPSPSPSNSQLK